MATMKASLYITIAAVLGGSLAALSAAAWPQGVDPQDKANRYGAATGQSNDSGGPPPADDTLRQRRDAGFPGPGTSADSGTGARTTSSDVRTGRGGAPNPAAGATPASAVPGR